jgi:hypothetical protein
MTAIKLQNFSPFGNDSSLLLALTTSVRVFALFHGGSGSVDAELALSELFIA